MTIELDYDCTVSEEDLLDPYRTREMSYEIREASNFFSFHGYIPWVEKAIVSGQTAHGVFPRELLGDMSFLSRMFYNENKLPPHGKYMLVDKDKIHMVVICSPKDKDRFAYHTQTTISLFVSFLNLANEQSEKACVAIQKDLIWLKDSCISKLTTKKIKGSVVIVNTFSPITKDILNANGLDYSDSQKLDVIGSDDVIAELRAMGYEP